MIIYIKSDNASLLNAAKNFLGNKGYYSFPQTYNPYCYVAIDTTTGKTSVVVNTPPTSNVITNINLLSSQLSPLPDKSVRTTQIPLVVVTDPPAPVEERHQNQMRFMIDPITV